MDVDSLKTYVEEVANADYKGKYERLEMSNN